MQLLHTVSLVLCIATVLSFKHDIRQTAETSTNEVDNSVIGREPENNFNREGQNAYGLKTYGGSGGYINTDQIQNSDIVPSTIAPQPEEVKPMPTTGCFGHHPEENGNNNNVENFPQPPKSLTDPMSQQFNPQNQGFGPQTQSFYPHQQRYFPHHFPHHHHSHFPHHHHPHFPYNSPNPWSPWRRNMQFAGQQQFYPQNPWSPWRRQMPFVMPPSASQFGPQNGNRPPLVIVKLLQPIILPVAKPFYPEGGEREPESEEVDSQKFASGGFQKYLNGRPHRMAFRRFGGERMRSFEDRTNGQNTYGPYKIHGDNLHLSIKLH